MSFPPSFLERLRSSYVLSELIGKHVQLKKHGREYQGLCPFHNEKSPSFTVNNEKGFYHCFGCAAHGDGIEFLKRHQHMNYREAVETLAREAGMEIPQMTPQQQQQVARERSLLDVTEAAAKWFRTQLSRSESIGARDYLARRGLHPETLERFSLGYAPSDRGGLKKHLLAEGFTEQQCIETGMLIRPDHGNSYDRFRSRIMFPIRSSRGKVVAFGGRLIEDQPNSPKYLNSPETPLFQKREMVYNLDLAGRMAREKGEITIVEGYMDVIAMAQAGFDNTVATLGTAVTDQHLRRLWNYAPEPILCLDGDSAGKRAMLRAAELVLPLLKPGNSIRFALLPTGEDPDTLIRQRGSEALAQVLNSSATLSETLWKTHSSEVSNTPEARASLEHTLMQLAEKIADQTVRNHTQSYFRRQIWQKIKAMPAKERLRGIDVERMAKSGSGDLHAPKMRIVLAILLKQPALLQRADVEDALFRMECPNPALSHLRQALSETMMHSPDFSSDELIASLEQEGYKHVVEAVLNETLLPKDISTSLPVALSAWQHTIQEEMQVNLEAEYRELQSRIGTELDETSYARFFELQNALKELNKKRKFSSFDD